MPKRSIRAQFLAQRKALPQDRCDTLSEQIQKKFLCSELFAEVKFLALYCAVHNEVSTDMVGNQALAAGKRPMQSTSDSRIRLVFLQVVLHVNHRVDELLQCRGAAPDPQPPVWLRRGLPRFPPGRD